ATNYDTQDDRRMFAILGKPGADISNPGELKGVPVAASSNTVIHFVIEKLLTAGGLDLDEIKLVEAKNIGIRFQMLITGQVDAAALPEPLVSAAIGQGAVMIADDSGISASQTVLVFKEDFAETYPKEVKNFLAAVNKAAAFISQNPDSVRDAMVQYARLPEAMKDRFRAPLFPALHAPDQASVDEAVQWLERQEVLRKTLHYENLVSDVYLP
ncbi:MAG: ABC transporter substrate-binding protein, partial [bacterium]